MNGHCCTCGAKRPKNWRDEGWISIRADNDPMHLFCNSCRHENDASGGDTLTHIMGWRKGQLGCRINDNPNVKQWRNNPPR